MYNKLRTSRGKKNKNKNKLQAIFAYSFGRQEAMRIRVASVRVWREAIDMVVIFIFWNSRSKQTWKTQNNMQ